MFCFPTDTPCTPLAPAFFNSQIYSTACWPTYSLTRRLTPLFCPFRSYVRWVAQPCSHQLRLPYCTTTSQCSSPSSLPLLIYGLYASPNNLFNMSYPSPMLLPHYQPMPRLLNSRMLPWAVRHSQLSAPLSAVDICIHIPDSHQQS